VSEPVLTATESGGGINSIDIENPGHVQLHVGKISDPPDDTAEECQVVVRAESVEFVSGQGPGEGALELTMAANPRQLAGDDYTCLQRHWSVRSQRQPESAMSQRI
jgi:hypothetical protein